MKKWSKFMALAMSAVLLAMTPKAEVRAEEKAPFTADQLLAVVNAQCANVTSLHEVLKENVQVVNTRTNDVVMAELVVDVVESRDASHQTYMMNMVSDSYIRQDVMESWQTVENGYYKDYTCEDGVWTLEKRKTSAERLQSLSSPLILDGLDTSNSVVVADGQVFRFTAVADDSIMSAFSGSMNSRGLNGNAKAFPVTVEIDATSLLPISITMDMTGMEIDSSGEYQSAAVAVMTFDSFNQFDDLKVPAQVKAQAK